MGNLEESVSKHEECGFCEDELADEELDNVTGGTEGCKPDNPYEIVYYKTMEEVQFTFNVGDQVEAFGWGCKHHTATCTVRNRRVLKACHTNSLGQTTFYGYIDQYYLEKNAGVKTVFESDWYDRGRIEK